MGHCGLIAPPWLPGAKHDNRLCSALLSALLPQTILLTDRGYDADWIRELARQQGAWANIPPKRNREDPICFSPYLYRARYLIERCFKIKQNWRVATRYDKLVANHFAFIKFAPIRIMERFRHSGPHTKPVGNQLMQALTGGYLDSSPSPNLATGRLDSAPARYVRHYRDAGLARNGGGGLPTVQASLELQQILNDQFHGLSGVPLPALQA